MQSLINKSNESNNNSTSYKMCRMKPSNAIAKDNEQGARGWSSRSIDLNEKIVRVRKHDGFKIQQCRGISLRFSTRRAQKVAHAHSHRKEQTREQSKTCGGSKFPVLSHNECSCDAIEPTTGVSVLLTTLHSALFDSFQLDNTHQSWMTLRPAMRTIAS